MHDWHWQPAADWGARYDFGVLPSPWGFERVAREILRVPAAEWWCYRRPRQRRRHEFPARLRDRPVRVEAATWIDIEALIGCDRRGSAVLHPGDVSVVTRGTAGIVMARLLGQAERIIAVGCDALLSEVQWTPYPAEHPRPTAEGTDDRHDMPREGRVLRRWCQAHAVDLVRAEEVWA